MTERDQAREQWASILELRARVSDLTKMVNWQLERIAELESERDEERILRRQCMDAAEIVEAERHKLRMGRLLADATIAELEAERDRLRAALTEIDAHGGGSWIGEIARAALAGEEKPDGGLIPQPTRREMGVDAPDFGPLLGEGKP